MPDNYSDNPEEQTENKIVQKLTVGQKVATGSLAVFAVLVVGLWAAQFKKSIQGPFAYNEKAANSVAGNSVFDKNSDENLRAKDTDGDGLSDWDEFNIYKTSPYLEDSDSDGISDKKEIDSGNDPNCPVGKDCYGTNMKINKNNTDNTINSEKKLDLKIGLDSIGSSSAGQIEEGAQNILSGQSNADTLRKMLLKAGMDEKILNQISDEDLMKSYKETLNQ